MGCTAQIKIKHLMLGGWFFLYFFIHNPAIDNNYGFINRDILQPKYQWNYQYINILGTKKDISVNIWRITAIQTSIYQYFGIYKLFWLGFGLYWWSQYPSPDIDTDMAVF